MKNDKSALEPKRSKLYVYSFWVMLFSPLLLLLMRPLKNHWEIVSVGYFVMSGLATVICISSAIRYRVQRVKNSKDTYKWWKIGVPVVLFGTAVILACVLLYKIPMGFAIGAGAIFAFVMFIGLA
jgi:hypothetical protein